MFFFSTFQLDNRLKADTLTSMRFCSFGPSPSLFSRMGGLGFLKAYAYAAVMPRRPKGFKWARQQEIKANLVQAGFLPRPGQKKSYAALSKLYQPTARSIPTVPPDVDPKWVGKPRIVIPPRPVCASRYQPQPAAVSNTGGLRGSLATRGRRL